MTDREIMQQALDLLKSAYVSTALIWDRADCVESLETALAQPEQEPVTHAVIAGVLFDFMGWLTSRPKRLVLSASDDASPAVKVIEEFAKMRGMSLDDAKVKDWQAQLAQPEQEPVKKTLRLKPHECICGYSVGHPLVPKCICKPEYTAQPEQEELIQFKDGKWSYVRKPWQGLTDEQLSETYNDLYTQYTKDDVNIADFILIARAIEAKLKEKNT